MTRFAELAVGDRFIAVTTGVVYFKRTASEYGSGQAERVAQPGDSVMLRDDDGAVRFMTTVRGDTLVERSGPGDA